MEYLELMRYIDQCLKQCHDAMIMNDKARASALAVEMAKASEALTKTLTGELWLEN